MALNIDPRIGAAAQELIMDANDNVDVDVIIIAFPAGNPGDKVTPSFVSSLSPEYVIGVIQEIAATFDIHDEPTVTGIYTVEDEIKH
jgi:hypothetical protein